MVDFVEGWKAMNCKKFAAIVKSFRMHEEILVQIGSRDADKDMIEMLKVAEQKLMEK